MPPSASSNRPARSRNAPVNAPRAWPKNSLSYSSRGTAAQFTLISGLPARLLRRCTSRATSSLPVPLSPRMRTAASVGATRSIWRASASSAGPWPTSSPNAPARVTSSRRYSFSSSSLRLSSSIRSNARAVAMAAAAWSAMVRSQSMQSRPTAPRANTASTPSTCPRWTSGWPPNPATPSARTQSGRAIQSGGSGSRSRTSIGSPVAAIRPTFRTPSGNRRNAPSSRVHSTSGSTADRPPLATRCRQAERSRHSAAMRQPVQSSDRCTSQIRASATRGDSANRSTTRRSRSGSACSRAISRSSLLGSTNSGAAGAEVMRPPHEISQATYEKS